jgi:hypothetical protein
MFLIVTYFGGYIYIYIPLKYSLKMVGLAHICLFGFMLGNYPIWPVKSVGSKFDFETKILN